MSVAKVSEISATSSQSFEDAIQRGLSRASKTLRHIRRLDVLGTSALVAGDGIVEYRTQVRLVFEIDR